MELLPAGSSLAQGSPRMPAVPARGELRLDRLAAVRTLPRLRAGGSGGRVGFEVGQGRCGALHVGVVHPEGGTRFVRSRQLAQYRAQGAGLNLRLDRRFIEHVLSELDIEFVASG